MSSPVLHLLATPRFHGIFLTILAAVLPVSLHGQTIRGRVEDATRQTPIPAVQITVGGAAGYRTQVLTDSVGSFTVQLPDAGTYWITASALGYISPDSAYVTLENGWEMVEVRLSLSAEPLEVEGFTVVGRGMEPRHQATFEGFLERHKTSLAVGRSRVVSIEDPIMRTAAHVGDVLQWFDAAGRDCTVVYVDGRVRTGWGNVERENVAGLAGIEFYKDYRDAPLEFRDGGPPCLRFPKFSVLVLWRERSSGGGGSL